MYCEGAFEIPRIKINMEKEAMHSDPALDANATDDVMVLLITI